MVNLTQDNYFSTGTKALTHSKIKDYALCPNYFYRKHILNELEDGTSDAFIFGGVVDKLLSGESFNTKYRIVPRRTAALKEEAALNGETLILQSQYDEIIEVASAVELTDAFQHIKLHANTQDILQVPMEINEHFDSLAGKPDFWWLDKETGVCFIVDLKTAQSADPRRYYYQAIGYHYDSQLANYQSLILTLHPEVKAFRSFNLVAAKQKEVYSVELFEFTPEQMNIAHLWLQKQIKALSQEKEYKKYNPSFDKPVIFGDWNGSQDDEEIVEE